MTMTPVAVISGFAPDNNYAVPIVRDKCIYILHEIPRRKKSMNQNRGVRIDVVGYDEKKDNYFAVIEELWDLHYGPLIMGTRLYELINFVIVTLCFIWYIWCKLCDDNFIYLICKFIDYLLILLYMM